MYLPKNAKRKNIAHLIPTLVLLTGICLAAFSCSEESNLNVKELPSDQTVTEAVKAQLNSRTGLPADSIDITTNNGIVTLSGSITNLLAKKRATNVTESITGVISVVNNLKITASRPDKALNKDIDQALKTDPATENWEIVTEVHNGLVTLTGAVDSWQEKQLAASIVSGVKGVKMIRNNIMVADDEDRKAADIKAEVKQTLKYDSRIRDDMIKVSATDSTVTLSGSVGSPKEKQLARQKAHVRGVDQVIAKNLEVHPEYNSKMFASEEIHSLSPSVIERAIKRAMAYNPRVPATNIEVEVKDSIATLTGTVKNLNSKLEAAEDARHTVGINTVNNNIEVIRKVVVRPEVPTTDKAIKNRIKNAIRRDPYVEEARIDVIVETGLVKLQGNVSSRFDKNQIEEIVQDVKGVISIANELQVQPKSGSTT